MIKIINVNFYPGIGLRDTREVDGIASVPAKENSFNVQEFDELEGLAETIFGGGDGTGCGMYPFQH